MRDSTALSTAPFIGTISEVQCHPSYIHTVLVVLVYCCLLLVVRMVILFVLACQYTNIMQDWLKKLEQLLCHSCWSCLLLLVSCCYNWSSLGLVSQDAISMTRVQKSSCCAILVVFVCCITLVIVLVILLGLANQDAKSMQA